MRLTRPFRWFPVLLAVALLVAPAAPAVAQGLTGPGGVFHFTTATLAVNTTTATANLLYATVPGNLANSIVRAKVIGSMGTNASPSLVVTCTYGSSTISIFNGQVGTSLSSVPVQIDCWVARTASTGGGGFSTTSSNQVFLLGRFATSASPNGGHWASGTGAINASAQQALTITWTWGTSHASNALEMMKGTAAVGP